MKMIQDTKGDCPQYSEKNLIIFPFAGIKVPLHPN